MESRTIAAALVLLCLAVSAHAQPAAGGEPASLDRDIRHLLELSGTSKLATQMMGTMIQSFKQMAPDAPAGFWDEFAKGVDPQELIEMIVPIYKKHLSHDDIRAAIAFYESPAGRHLVANQPAILQDSMAAGQQWGQVLGQRAMAKVKAAKDKH
jgi:hypothetical protein